MRLERVPSTGFPLLQKYLWVGIAFIALVIFLITHTSGWDKRTRMGIQSQVKHIDGIKGTQPDSALALAHKAWKIALDRGWKKEMAKIQHQIFWLKVREMEFKEEGEEALANGILSLKLYEELKDELGMALTADLLAYCHLSFGRNDSALYYRSLSQDYLSEITEKEDSLLAEAYITNTHGAFQEDQVVARALYKRSNRVFSDLNHTEGMAMTYFNLGTSWSASGNLMRSIEYIRNAQTLYKSIGWDKDFIESTLEEGNIYMEQFSQSGDETSFMRAKNIYDQILQKAHIDLAYALYNLGWAYHYRTYWEKKNNAPDWKMYEDSAKYFYERSIHQAKKEKDFPTLLEIGDALEVFCKDRSDCSSFFPLFLNSAEEIISTGKTALLEVDNQLRAAEQAELRREAQAQRDRMLLGLGIIVGLILLGAILFHQRQRIAFFQRQLLAKMQKLQAQMNPHFISNCLSAVDSLILQNKPKEASNYLIQFSRLCRIILRNSLSTQITLQEEIQALNYYLSLEKLRMNDKLTYSVDIAKEIVPKSTWVPPSLIQPFVENAIWHGIQHKESPGHVSIKVESKSTPKGYGLTYIIEDNGVGRKKAKELKEESVVQPYESKKSLGIMLTEERIQLASQYPGTKLQIEDLSDLEGKPQGTRVTIQLPIES